jgi:hypothetical protein
LSRRTFLHQQYPGQKVTDVFRSRVPKEHHLERGSLHRLNRGQAKLYEKYSFAFAETLKGKNKGRYQLSSLVTESNLLVNVISQPCFRMDYHSQKALKQEFHAKYAMNRPDPNRK